MGETSREELNAWIDKAADDLLAARLIAQNRGPTTVGCYLCQQALEKLLKALLIHAGLTAPRSHDLVDLHQRLGAHAHGLGLSLADLRGWSAYATAARYPGFPDLKSDTDLTKMITAAAVLLAHVRGQTTV